MSILKTIRTFTLVVVPFLAALASAQVPVNAPMDSDQKAAVLKSMEDIITKRAYVPGVDFAKWPDLVKKHQTGIDEAKDQVQFTNVMNSALHEFGFSHIVLFSPQMADARTSRGMVGLGVRIQLEDRGIRIVFVFPGTGADEAGLREGDLIVAGDGKPVKTPADLTGEEGTKVKVTIERDGKPKDFVVTRRKFSTDIPETLKWSSDDTAVLTIPTFDLGYKKDNVAILMNEAMKAKYLVLDLRGNGGGAVTNLLHLANFFFDPTTPIGTFVNRPMAEMYSKETSQPATDAIAVAAWAKDKLHTQYPKSEYFKGKVAVLVNGGTGSASEMMAAALKENLGARLVGSKTAGAVLASLMTPISEKFLLQFPLMDYVTTKGYRIEGHGLEVDKVAPITKVGEADQAVSIAVKLLQSG